MKITSTQLKNLIREEAKKIHEQEDDAAATADDETPAEDETKQPEESEEKVTGFNFKLIKKQLSDKKPDLNKKELSAHYYSNGEKGDRYGVKVTADGLVVNGQIYVPVQKIYLDDDFYDSSSVDVIAQNLSAEGPSGAEMVYELTARHIDLTAEQIDNMISDEYFDDLAVLSPDPEDSLFLLAREIEIRKAGFTPITDRRDDSNISDFVEQLGIYNGSISYVRKGLTTDSKTPDEFVEMIKSKLIILSMDEGDYTGIMKGDPFTYSYFPATKEFKVTGLSSKGEKVKGKRRARYDKAIGRVGKEGSKLHKVLTRRMKSPNAPAKEEETAAGEEEQTNESVEVRKIRRLIRDEIELIKRT